MYLTTMHQCHRHRNTQAVGLAELLLRMANNQCMYNVLNFF